MADYGVALGDAVEMLYKRARIAFGAHEVEWWIVVAEGIAGAELTLRVTTSTERFQYRIFPRLLGNETPDTLGRLMDKAIKSLQRRAGIRGMVTG